MVAMETYTYARRVKARVGADIVVLCTYITEDYIGRLHAQVQYLHLHVIFHKVCDGGEGTAEVSVTLTQQRRDEARYGYGGLEAKREREREREDIGQDTSMISLHTGKHLWRNRLARSAVNRKVAGSSPARCEVYILFSQLQLYIHVYTFKKFCLF